jgi:hypothetical protein
MRLKKWPLVSACHAGRLGDHQTPVGSGEIICTFFLVLIEHLFLYIDIFHLYYPLVSAFSHTCAGYLWYPTARIGL